MSDSQTSAIFNKLQARLREVPHPRCHEFWIEPEWRTWKRVIRAVGKRPCVNAGLTAVHEVFKVHVRDIEAQPATGFLPEDLHTVIASRLEVALIQWLQDDNHVSRLELRCAITQLREAIAAEHAKYTYYVVTSTSQPVRVYGLLAEAAVASSNFDKHIRTAFVQADSIHPACSARFRELLGRQLNCGVQV